MTVTHNNYSDDLIFENITILGVQVPVASVKVSHHGMGETRLSSSLFTYDAEKKVKWVSNTRATLPAAGRNPVKSIHPSGFNTCLFLKIRVTPWTSGQSC